MHELDYYPRPCEVKASMSAAVDAYDGLDDTVDGVVSSQECQSNPFALAGQSDCNGTNTAFTANGASMMESRTERRRARPIESFNGMATVSSRR
jgi:hypothetical protein